MLLSTQATRGRGPSSLQSRTQEEKWDAQDTGFQDGSRETAQAGPGWGWCRSACTRTISPPTPHVRDHSRVSLVASETMRTTQRVTSEQSCQQPTEGSAAATGRAQLGAKAPRHGAGWTPGGH